jgi:PAS domain S-box-containing protein
MKCANDSILLADEHGRILEANDRALETYGYSLADLRQKTIESLRTPESRAELPHQIEQMETDGRAVFEAMNQRRDGAAFPVEISARFIEIAGVLYRLGIVRDITERKRAEAFARLERDLGMALAAAHELDETLRLCLEVAMRAAGMDCGAIYLKNHATGCLDMVVYAGLSAEFVENVSRCEADSPKTRLVEAGKPVYVNYVRLAPPLSQAERREGLRAIAVVPIRHENRTIGCLNVASHTLKEVLAFARDAVEAIASQVGSAVARAQTEQALRESEERLDRVVKNINDALIVDDVAGRAVYANEKFFQLFRIPERKLHSLSLEDYVAPEWRKELRDRHDRRVRGEPVPGHFEYEGLRGDGSRLWLEVSVAKVCEGGRIVGTQSAIRDITERKQAERELRESEEKFAAAFHASLNLMAITRVADGTILEVNEGYSRLLGYSRGESVGKTTTELSIWVDPADRATFVERLKESGQITDFETTLRRKDGSVITVLDSAQTMKIQDETCILSVAHDITERRQAEERVRMFSQEIIAAREQERKQVSSVLHHDVGSLAVGIAAHLDAIEGDLRARKPREALKWMKRTRKLFDKSVVRLKKLAVELRPPELDVLGLCAALRQHFAQVSERGRTRIHFRETLGRTRVSGGAATILFRAAQEALTNAITHGQATRVDADLRASKEEVALRVHDNGKGFNPSEQMARATSQMGLRVMHEMATAAGGVFTVDSRRGKGTTVCVRLPIADRGLRNAD